MSGTRSLSLEQVVARTGELPPMPLVARKVMDLAGSPDTSPEELQRVISGDPALVSKILRIANSALYNQGRNVATLSQAIFFLGSWTIRSLVLASATRSVFLSRAGEYGLKEQLLWEHSLGCALAARLIAKQHGLIDPEIAFLGGLLHDIGKIVLNTNQPGPYAEVFQRVYNDGCSFSEAEQEQLGFTHAAVGALVARKWQLPRDIEDAISHHHELRAAASPQPTAAVHLGNLLCKRAGIGAEKKPRLELGQAESLPVLCLSERQAELLIERLTLAFEQGRAAFAT